MWKPGQILAILDRCADAFTFPMLDNGYVYLAATRLSLDRSDIDWAMVIEVFGFSPRAGLPDLHVYTFGSRLRDRDEPSAYATADAHQAYLDLNPYNESRFFYPVSDGPWRNVDDCDSIASDARSVIVRDHTIDIPHRDAFSVHGIVLEDPANVRTWELCRYLAETSRELILATPAERRISVPQELSEILVLDLWQHPDLLKGEKPSSSPSFVRFADALATGKVGRAGTEEQANTHWSNWPEGGTL